MDDKLSKFNIEVEHCSCVLLYNALTNKLLPISFQDYAVIETLMEHLPEFRKRYPKLYQSFRDSGFIISSDFDELAFIKLQNKKKIFANNDYKITINPTLDCNLNCWYCSVSTSGAVRTKERMSDETIESLNKHISYLITKKKVETLMLDWFGGEPLMYFDEVIARVSEFSQKMVSEHSVGFAQQITTNGTLLNEERIRMMKDYRFIFFQITLDGNELRHNQIRHYADKKGSYKDIIHNINLLCSMMPEVHVCLRINYDMQTLKNIRDIIRDLSEESRKNIVVDFQRVWQVKCTDEMRQLLQEAKEEFKAAGFYSDFWAYRPLSFKCCYADNYNYYAINYNGKVFKCTARDYSDKLVIGNLQPSGMIDWNEGLLGKMYKKATFEHEECEKCKMLPLCMGPCIQKNYEMLRDNKPFQCLYKNVEYSLSAYITDLAKQRKLIE